MANKNDFPGGVQIVYGQNLRGTTVIGIDGALRAADRYSGIQFTNECAIYGTEMPDEVHIFIVEALSERYAPVGNAALEAKAAGDANGWEKLRKEAGEILQAISGEAKQMWKEKENAN
jgi:hypothetical protein